MIKCPLVWTEDRVPWIQRTTHNHRNTWTQRQAGEQSLGRFLILRGVTSIVCITVKFHIAFGGGEKISNLKLSRKINK